MLYIDIHKYVIHTYIYIINYIYILPLIWYTTFIFLQVLLSPCRRKSMKPWNARMRWSKTTARNAARRASSLGKTRGDVACFFFLSWRLTYLKSCGMVWYPGIFERKEWFTWSWLWHWRMWKRLKFGKRNTGGDSSNMQFYTDGYSWIHVHMASPGQETELDRNHCEGVGKPTAYGKASLDSAVQVFM